MSVPKMPENKKRGRKVSQSTMDAVGFVLDGWTIYKAAKHFGVSYTSVKRQLDARVTPS